jgi:hypothetical protein
MRAEEEAKDLGWRDWQDQPTQSENATKISTSQVQQHVTHPFFDSLTKFSAWIKALSN